MYKARVEAEFSAAHFLSRYHGKCENLHGHNYRVRLWVRGESLDAGGMLADFAVLKKCLRDALVPLDHGNLNDTAAFQNNPSAERIARYIFEELRELLPGAGLDAALLWAVDVFETPANMARYEERVP
ncbi:MAG: 6-carboxytetrahydropterin synthase QueD [Treponema sp.]|jgi:6-pyruvoyltetrahydropterin/6-carboxytetrahydropterin synthase|nr:6-carboxytetrahydropterin synthase QueD [Treponema sp.]